MNAEPEFAPPGTGNSFVPTSRRKPPPVPESPGTRQASGRPVLADEDVDPLCETCGKRRPLDSFIDKNDNRKPWCRSCRWQHMRKRKPPHARGLSNGARWENRHRRHS